MSTSVKAPVTMASLLQAPYDDEPWVNPTLVGSNDAYYATVTATTFDTDDYSYILNCTNFAHAIPIGEGGTTIEGIEVKVQRKQANGAVRDAVIQLTMDAVSRIGDDKADLVNNWPAVEAVATYGSSTDNWGLALFPELVNLTNFGVQIVCKAIGDDADAYINYVEMTVYYTTMAGVPRVMSSRRGRFLQNPAGDISNQSAEWRKGHTQSAIVAPLVIAPTPTTALLPYTDAGAVTISIASPGIVTLAGHGMASDREIWLKTSGALPTGVTQYTHYYVKYIGVDTFNLAATVGGANINTSGSQSGTHNLWRKD